MAAHPGVDLITFTGSVGTGSRIMQTAGRNLTRVNLELGGKAPAIVLASADLDLAAKAISDSRMINTGQVCNCAERVYVERAVHDAFVDKLKTLFETTRYGDPSIEGGLIMGPLVNRGGLDKVAAAVDRARADGASIVTGGRIADRPSGHHYEPTLITGAKTSHDIMHSEIFGPVLPVQAVDGLDEAMQGFHAGRRKSGIGGADGKHGLYAFTETHVFYIQGR